MTKISQLSDIGGNLAANDEFIIRDVSDASTPNKKVTASGFFNVATALGFTGLDTIVAGVTNEAKVQVFASGISGRADTTISGVIPARTTISGYFENASGTVGGTFFPVVTQTDIGTDPNQVPLNGFLGTMAFQDSAGVNIDLAAIGTATISSATISGGTATLSSAAVTAFSNVPLLTGGGLTFPATQVASADPNTLDDYEEGTWTPDIANGYNVGSTIVYTSQVGSYTKIGRLVVAAFHLEILSIVGGGGPLFFYGLPFAPASTTDSRFQAAIQINGTNTPVSPVNVLLGYAKLDNGNYYLTFNCPADDTAISNARCISNSTVDWATGDTVGGTFTYFV
jgi:hypothetical protein